MRMVDSRPSPCITHSPNKSKVPICSLWCIILTVKKGTHLQTIILILGIVYALFSSYTWYFQGVEHFPFYSWDLFSYVPNSVDDYQLQIIELDGQPIDPIYFNQADAYFVEASSIVIFHNIQTFGRAVQNQQESEATNTRLQIESNAFPQYNTVTYHLVKRLYNPLQQMQTGEGFLEEQIIATYQKE